MKISLSGRDYEVSGAPPFIRAAIFRAHPIPDPPLIPIKRADGGYDYWPDKNNEEYKRNRVKALFEREQALWEFYILECLDATPPDDWRESETWTTLLWAGVKAREGPKGLKLDWVEYELIKNTEEHEKLRRAFRDVNDPSEEDYKAAEEFFNVRWKDVPIVEAVETLEPGKLSYAQGFMEYRAAATWGLLPLSSDELPHELKQNQLLYYDLPPALRARLETYVKISTLIDVMAAKG